VARGLARGAGESSGDAAQQRWSWSTLVTAQEGCPPQQARLPAVSDGAQAAARAGAAAVAASAEAAHKISALRNIDIRGTDLWEIICPSRSGVH
jgi:hypothetical protein